MTRILRVFPRRTSLTPTDDLVAIGEPSLMRPEADEVHVSCAFTWDRLKAEHLAEAWKQYYPNVKIGGPVFGVNGEFVPGRYVKEGVTFTSRGCNNRCSPCMVPDREGKIKEIETFAPGWVLNDNNLLQCSKTHIERVFEMLRVQPKPIEFTGGIDARLVTPWFSDMLKTIRIKQLFLAADTPQSLKALRHAVDLIGWLGKGKLRCYTLIGEHLDMSADTERLEEVFKIGCMPYAQLYQPPKDKLIKYSKQWKHLQWVFCRPAATKAYFKVKPPMEGM